MCFALFALGIQILFDAVVALHSNAFVNERTYSHENETALIAEGTRFSRWYPAVSGICFLIGLLILYLADLLSTLGFIVLALTTLAPGLFALAFFLPMHVRRRLRNKDRRLKAEGDAVDASIESALRQCAGASPDARAPFLYQLNDLYEQTSNASLRARIDDTFLLNLVEGGKLTACHAASFIAERFAVDRRRSVLDGIESMILRRGFCREEWIILSKFCQRDDIASLDAKHQIIIKIVRGDIAGAAEAGAASHPLLKAIVSKSELCAYSYRHQRPVGGTCGYLMRDINGRSDSNTVRIPLDAAAALGADAEDELLTRFSKELPPRLCLDLFRPFGKRAESRIRLASNSLVHDALKRLNNPHESANALPELKSVLQAYAFHVAPDLLQHVQSLGTINWIKTTSETVGRGTEFEQDVTHVATIELNIDDVRELATREIKRRQSDAER